MENARGRGMKYTESTAEEKSGKMAMLSLIVERKMGNVTAFDKSSHCKMAFAVVCCNHRKISGKYSDAVQRRVFP